MGYDLHITRAEYWTESADNPIRSSEWISLVENDSELIIDPVSGASDVLWIGHPSELKGWPLWLSEGEIYTKNPDEHVVIKMIAIARNLKARVVGDDGEVYTYDGRRVLSAEGNLESRVSSRLQITQVMLKHLNNQKT